MLKQFYKLSVPIRVMGCLFILLGFFACITIPFVLLVKSYFTGTVKTVDSMIADDLPVAPSHTPVSKAVHKKPPAHSTEPSK